MRPDPRAERERDPAGARRGRAPAGMGGERQHYYGKHGRQRPAPAPGPGNLEGEGAAGGPGVGGRGGSGIADLSLYPPPPIVTWQHPSPQRPPGGPSKLLHPKGLSSQPPQDSCENHLQIPPWTLPSPPGSLVALFPTPSQ